MKHTFAAFVLLAAGCAHDGEMKINDPASGNTDIQTTNSPTKTTSSMTRTAGNSDYEQCLQDYDGYAGQKKICDDWMERWHPANSTACAEPCPSTLTSTPYYR